MDNMHSLTVAVCLNIDIVFEMQAFVLIAHYGILLVLGYLILEVILLRTPL